MFLLVVVIRLKCNCRYTMPVSLILLRLFRLFWRKTTHNPVQCNFVTSMVIGFRLNNLKFPDSTDFRVLQDHMMGFVCVIKIVFLLYKIISYSTPLSRDLWKREPSTRTLRSIQKVLGTCPQHNTIKFEVRQIPSSEIGKNLHVF